VKGHLSAQVEKIISLIDKSLVAKISKILKDSENEVQQLFQKLTEQPTTITKYIAHKENLFYTYLESLNWIKQLKLEIKKAYEVL
jgi:hypothetical protein